MASAARRASELAPARASSCICGRRGLVRLRLRLRVRVRVRVS